MHSVNILCMGSAYATFSKEYSHAADVHGRRVVPLSLLWYIVATKRENTRKRECSILPEMENP